jgi:hypothetical protein
MKFHAEFEIEPLEASIQHTHSLMLVGSCFTENMGDKLSKHKFKTLENPNGIVFNPVSVADTINSCIENKTYNESDLFPLNGGWHSWLHHSRFSDVTVQGTVHKINASTQAAHIYLKQADYLFITLGSAWVYQLTKKALNAKQGLVAANNHKAPADWFEKKLLTPQEVTDVLERMMHQLLAFNSYIKIIFTISPVRHLREGMINNNRSKAVLIQAVHELISASTSFYYFPAYELVIDDLRDYRFYAEDLVHPNYAATNYVWDKFVNAGMNENTKELMKQIADINLAYQHKPFNPSSLQHQIFLKTYAEKTRVLQLQHPYINFQKEMEYFLSASS